MKITPVKRGHVNLTGNENSTRVRRSADHLRVGQSDNAAVMGAHKIG